MPPTRTAPSETSHRRAASLAQVLLPEPDGPITLFIHEAVHIWQHQMGFPVRLSGLCIALKGCYKKQKAYQYKHLLEKYQRFSQFNMEQQAEIITNYFVAQYFYQQPLTELRPILQDFLDNPKNKKLLPENICFQAA